MFSLCSTANNDALDRVAVLFIINRYNRRINGGSCMWLTTLPPSLPDLLEIFELEPPGTLRAFPEL
jgi:hypothetical protein